MPTRTLLSIGLLCTIANFASAENAPTIPQVGTIVEYHAPAVPNSPTAAQPISPPNASSTRTTGTNHSSPRKNLVVKQPGKNSNGKSNAANRFGQLTGGKSLSTALAGLSIVLGVFLLFAWMFKKGMPKGSGRLPTDVIDVLGRTTLSPKQTVHLVKLGNKLLLLSFTASGAETLAEVTDPDEVTRLIGLCGSNSSGSSKAFLDAFTQLNQTKAHGFLERTT